MSIAARAGFLKSRTDIYQSLLHYGGEGDSQGNIGSLASFHSLSPNKNNKIEPSVNIEMTSGLEVLN